MTDPDPGPASAEQLVAAFKANPNRRFSPGQAEMLEAAADRDIWAAKAAALHHFRNEDYERALVLMRAVLEREPSAENIKNIAVALRSLGRAREALDWVESRGDAMAPIERSDMLCSLYRLAGEIPKAVAIGDEALRLKDAAAPRAPLPEPVVHRFDPAERSRNVIAFSLWGGDVRYVNGAITNAIVARYLYPGWTSRFYVDRSVPEEARSMLVRNGAQVVLLEDLPAAQFGTFWRFLVEDDPSIDIYLVRDADSVVNVKERWAVADWLKSGRAFHVMRDNPQHSELMLAGMWGAHRGNIGDMRERVERAVDAGKNVGNNLTLDQHFLRNVIWPIARNSVKIHDDYFSFMDPSRFSEDFPLPRPMHIGQNDWVNFRKDQ